MPIFHSLKSNTSRAKPDSDAGFTLLECILAIGILAIVIANIVGLQSSIVSVTQIESNHMKAKWALKSAISQLQYVLDTQGQANIPENSNFTWSADKNFTIKVTRKEIKNMKTSQFLETALSIYNLTSPDGKENLDVKEMLAPIAPFLDASSNIEPRGYFSSATVSVSWPEGKKNKSLNESLFLIDKNILTNVSLPSPSPSPAGSN